MKRLAVAGVVSAMVAATGCHGQPNAGAGGGVGGAAVSGAGGDTTPAGPSCPDGQLYASDRQFVDVFDGPAGPIIVQDNAILSFAHDGTLQKQIASARPITAAAFDGETLVIADSAILTAYSLDLVNVGQVLLTQSCRELAAMPGGLTICFGGGVFYSYDVRAGKLITQSTGYSSFVGDHLLPVPGTSDFVTWSTDLYLYQMAADGTITFVDGSPNMNTDTTSFIGNQVFAFSTPQATDLIDWEGRLFLNRGDDCTPVSPYLEKSRCFTGDGQLGTLPASAAGTPYYVALGNGAPGEVVGLVSGVPEMAQRPYVTSPCGTTGCLLQRIDYPSKTVTAQRRLDITPKTALALRVDTACQQAVLAYEVVGSLSPTASEWTGYRVDMVGFVPPAGGAGGHGGQGGRGGHGGQGGKGGGNAGSSGAGGTAAGGTGGTSPSTGCAPVGLLDTSTSPLVNAFVVPDGIIVVRASSIALLGRDRTVKTMLTVAAPISSAAFDGKTLATADTANVNVYTSALAPVGTVALRDPCFDSFIAPGGIFICEPDRQHQMIFTAFDLAGLRFLTETVESSLGGGVKLLLAPGTPYFALPLGSSPAIILLAAVDPGGSVRLVGSTQAGSTLDHAFGFTGSPPSDLMLSTGTLLKLFGPTCDAAATMSQSGCLQPDGMLGTLQARDRFVALDGDSAGTLVGLVSHDGSSDAFDSTPCTAGCSLQKLDVPGRAIAAQKEHALDAREILFLRNDPTCQMAVVGYQSPATSTYPTITFPYRVDLLDYVP